MDRWVDVWMKAGARRKAAVRWWGISPRCRVQVGWYRVGGIPTGRPEASPFQARLHLLAALITARQANPDIPGLARFFLFTICALQQRRIRRKLLGM